MREAPLRGERPRVFKPGDRVRARIGAARTGTVDRQVFTYAQYYVDWDNGTRSAMWASDLRPIVPTFHVRQIADPRHRLHRDQPHAGTPFRNWTHAVDLARVWTTRAGAERYIARHGLAGLAEVVPAAGGAATPAGGLDKGDKGR